MDDIIVAKNDNGLIDELKPKLDNEFKINNLANLKYFIGIEVAKSRDGIDIYA